MDRVFYFSIYRNVFYPEKTRSRMKMKRGEVTTAQLVTTIVLVASFVVILYFLFALDLGGTTSQEICRNSVAIKGKSIPGATLDCKTNYVTIEGETKEEVMHAIASEMEDCWWTFGEGQVNYGSAGGVPPDPVEYAVCSQIEFAQEVQTAFPVITYSEFYGYLEATERKDSGESYLEYLYGISKASDFEIDPRLKVDLTKDRFSTADEYSVVTGADTSKVGVADFQPGAYLKVHIIPVSEVSTRLNEDREFVTQA